MKKIAQKITDLLASAPVIVAFALWVVIHTIWKHEYVTFISDVTFLVALIILLDDKTFSDILEKLSKRTEKASKEDLQVSKRIERKVNKLDT